jgi:O-antigen/teichoic acid export membrane protein
VRISVIGRILTLAAVAFLPLGGFGVVGVMVATAVVSIISLWLQIVHLKSLVQAGSLWPAFDERATRVLLGFGIFTWMQAVGGLLFGQVDRLIAGVSMGAAAVTSYALCVQMAQPIYGLAAAGLHFLFPYLSARSTGHSLETLRRAVLYAFGANVLLVSAGTSILLIFGVSLLKVLGGNTVAHTGGTVLSLIIWSTAASGLSVTGSYALLALGHVRAVTWFNLAGGAMMMLLIPALLPRYGMYGIAMARLAYGPVMLLVYVPLAFLLFRRAPSGPVALPSLTQWEEA